GDAVADLLEFHDLGVRVFRRSGVLGRHGELVSGRSPTHQLTNSPTRLLTFGGGRPTTELGMRLLILYLLLTAAVILPARADRESAAAGERAAGRVVLVRAASGRTAVTSG